MDNDDIYAKLKGLFIDDIMGRLIPGAIHNLANPLGGIIGRVQLMQARTSKSFEIIEGQHPELYKELTLDRIKKDVSILAGEAEIMLLKLMDALEILLRKQRNINVPGIHLLGFDKVKDYCLPGYFILLH